MVQNDEQCFLQSLSFYLCKDGSMQTTCEKWMCELNFDIFDVHKHLANLIGKRQSLDLAVGGRKH